MRSGNFAFWLQGWFEIGQGKIKSLNPQQVEIISRHINIVYSADKNPSEFVRWLREYIDTCSKLSGKPSLSPKMVDIIQEKLNQEFEHIIDPSFGDNTIQNH